ncbi:putative flavoprotein involved in K+ transport [Promicromonospora umidemergens]|uniref:NAD(P)/FAD-dependent oxidoreductase n=1 Tax=Promicromonospora umidemergens TaxID=629679 RepID=A0ABP8X055_9MICO|nr:NAD(P)/FAD-dependent oxidoreductase [Promicromonospora umidemergens]MCP2285553.1 putative flavoprotein involved in K+ transport [Promicromonospora umidemergens]
MTRPVTRTVDVLVIGGGQAGLSMGERLRRTGREFTILEAGDRVGHSWRSRWDSLRLFTPARYAHLPGMPLPVPPWSYPGKETIAHHLEEYAAELHLPVEVGTRVTALRRTGRGFSAETTAGPWEAAHVVVATGPFQTPSVPASSDDLSSHVAQLHSSEYLRPAQLPDGTILVVGGGNSGYQIALELVHSGRDVHLSRGQHNVSVPQRPLGRDLFWWQDVLGVLDIPGESWRGRRMRANDSTVIGLPLRRLTAAGVALHERVTYAEGESVRFADDTTLNVDAVVWATGFLTDFSWIQIPGALDESGSPAHHRGVSTISGLYFLGLPWMHTTGSALLGFVWRDAAHLAATIQARCPHVEGHQTGTPGQFD